MAGTKRKPTARKASTNSKKSKAHDEECDPHSHWLIKSEPESRLESNGQDMKFSLDDLKAEPASTACWDGVRNYAARNNMRRMCVGQKVFFYHSNCKVPGIAGLVTVAREAYPDHTQFDRKDTHFDPKSSKDAPRWDMVDVTYERQLERFIPLQELKAIHLRHKASGKGALKDLALFTSARLSVQPLTKEEFDFILDLEHQA